MAAHNGTYTDFEGLRERAVALRREGLSLRQIHERLRVTKSATSTVAWKALGTA